ncbi:MAG: DUF1385 domain-containing protein, partial [Armatimonadota bacterium]
MGSDNSNTPSYGGQAVIEGVMMRGPKFYAVACRRSNKEIVVKQESVDSVMKGFQWLNKPFLRGTLALIDAMALGMKTLMFSANIQMEDIEMEEKLKKQAENPDSVVANPVKKQSINDARVAGTMVIGFALAIAIFVIGPNMLTNLLHKSIHNSILMNIVEGAVKMAMFVGYILLISMMKDIQRVFMYHGAEHKVINTFESGLELTAENISKYGTIHTRCGTSFMMIVIVLSIIVHFFIGWSPEWYLRIAFRLALLPVIAGIAYEVIKFAGKHKHSRILEILLAPGLLLQKITTREPTDDQVEVA